MILGIDFGTSSTDYVLADEESIKETGSIPSPYTVEQVKAKVPSGYQAIHVTGSGSAGVTYAKRIDEMTAIGRGGLAVSGLRKGLVVSIGSGTAMVDAKGDRFTHIGGTALGGRTLEGLGQLLLGVGDAPSITALAEKGTPGAVDISLRDLYPSGIGILPPTATAAHFGKPADASREDLAYGLVNMIAQSIATLAVFGARSRRRKAIIITGKLITLPLFERILTERTTTLLGETITIHPHAAVATALGAARS
jgi:type II pantothenate kinase